MRFMQSRRCLHELFFLYDGIKRVQGQEQKKIKKPVTIKVTGLPKQ